MGYKKPKNKLKLKVKGLFVVLLVVPYVAITFVTGILSTVLYRWEDPFKVLVIQNILYALTGLFLVIFVMGYFLGGILCFDKCYKLVKIGKRITIHTIVFLILPIIVWFITALVASISYSGMHSDPQMRFSPILSPLSFFCPIFTTNIVKDIHTICTYVVIVFCLGAYWINSFVLSSTFKFLQRKKKVPHVKQYLNLLKNSRPVITMNIECYHGDLKLVEHTESDPLLITKDNSKDKAMDLLPEGRKVTFQTFREFKFEDWRDETRDVLLPKSGNELTSVKYIQLKVDSEFILGDEETRKKFELECEEFKKKYKDKDEKYHFYTEVKLLNYKKTLMTKNDEKEPFYGNVWCYSIFSCLFLTCLFRHYFDFVMEERECVIKKRISVVKNSLLKRNENEKEIVISIESEEKKKEVKEVKEVKEEGSINK